MKFAAPSTPLQLEDHYGMVGRGSTTQSPWKEKGGVLLVYLLSPITLHYKLDKLYRVKGGTGDKAKFVKCWSSLHNALGFIPSTS